MSKEPTASTFMPLRGAKRWAYLDRQKILRLSSVDDDGSVYASPIYYVVHGKRILLPVDAAARHAKNAAAGRKVTGLVDSGDEYATVHGVRIYGDLKEITDTDLISKVDGMVFEKYFYEGHPYAESYFQYRVASGGRVFELEIDKMIGWDMREIALPAVPEARVLPEWVGDRLL